MRRLLSGLVASLVAIAPAALAVAPAPPDQVAYSGVLASAGPVALTARVYDAPSGGTLIFVQSFAGVALTDGHFTVNLGPTGAATDSPANPLTTSLRAALTDDLGAGPGRFVEITVNTDPPLARVQLVLVPYAMRSDHATTSDVATNALDSQALGGVSPVVLEAVYGAWNFDGGPPSNHPSEGTADPDNDGQVNFVDSDNDNDGQSDSEEVLNGSDLNLVTPKITTVSPSSGAASAVTTVTVTGANFLPGATVRFGTQLVTPSSLTPTSLQAGAGPLPGVFGTQPVDVTVTNANGEDAVKLNGFTFIESGTAPAPAPIPFTIPSITTVVSLSVQGNDETLAYGNQNTTGSNAYAVDTVADLNTVFNVSTNFTGRTPSALGWNASRVLYGLRALGSTNQVQLVRDANANFVLESAEALVLETPGGSPVTRSPSLAFDASGRPAGGYIRTGVSPIVAMAFHDRNGDGVFTGANELVTIETAGSVQALGDAQFDPSGRLAYVFFNSTLNAVRVAWDRSGDGDFADSVAGLPEVVSATSIQVPSCLAGSFDSSGRLGLVYAVNGAPTALYDWNGDVDFADAGETIPLTGMGFAAGCDVTRSPISGRLVFVFNRGTELRLAIDRNDDGDLVDALDNSLLTSASGAPLSVSTNVSGAVRVLSPQGVFLGPIE